MGESSSGAAGNLSSASCNSSFAPVTWDLVYFWRCALYSFETRVLQSSSVWAWPLSGLIQVPFHFPESFMKDEAAVLICFTPADLTKELWLDPSSMLFVHCLIIFHGHNVKFCQFFLKGLPWAFFRSSLSLPSSLSYFTRFPSSTHGSLPSLALDRIYS